MPEHGNIAKYMKEYGLTKRMVLFAIHFNGNKTQSARLAGYAHPETQGARLFKNAGVRALIDRLTARQSASDSASKLLTRNDLMAIWSELATDTEATWKDRLKAMDSLAKAQAIFIDRSQIISNVRVETLDKLSDQELYAKLDDVLAKLLASGVQIAIPQLPERTEDS